MKQWFITLALLLAPTLSYAQQAAPEAPPETPWGALISFLVFSIVAIAWTLWMVFRKKPDDQTKKD
jgi:hypothetical protein